MIEVESAGQAHEELILSLFTKAPGYFLSVEGCLPSLKTVQDALQTTPAHRGVDYKKEFLILRRQGEPIGTCEVHLHHPERGLAYIGLLQIREDLFGRGVGRACYDSVEDYVFREHDCHRVRLGVSDDNDVSGFWSKLGFKANGRTYAWMGERKSNNVVEYEKSISRA
jgi:RimJ/RimL family protein N-acetyltransferase